MKVKHNDCDDDGDSFSGRLIMLTGTGSFNRNGSSMQPSSTLGSQQMLPMASSNYLR